MGGRTVVGAFDGGVISSDAGAVLLGATDKAVRLVGRFATCFRDGRNAGLIEHTMATLIGQRLFAIALGHEDLNDHDALRHDPIMGILAGKLKARRKQCAAVAGKSTLSRLEHAPKEGPAFAPPRYHKISHNAGAIEALFVTLFLEAHRRQPAVHHSRPRCHRRSLARTSGGALLPRLLRRLLPPADLHLLRPASARGQATALQLDASAGSREEVARIVAQIRERWPKVEIGSGPGFAAKP